MAKIRSSIIEDVAKVARTASKAGKTAEPVVSTVSALPSRAELEALSKQIKGGSKPTVTVKPATYRGKPYLSTGRESLRRGSGSQSPYSAVVKPYAPEDVQVSRTVVNPAVTQKPVIDPASLQGGTMIGWVGDRAQAGTVVDSINGIPLAKPVRLQGGGDWMLDSSGSIMASNPSVTSGYLNKMRKLSENGKPVYSSYIAMGEQGVDFNKMVSDMFAGSRGDIRKTDARRIDSMIKNYKPKGSEKKVFEDFVGISSEDLDRYLADLSGGARSEFIKLMDKASIQDIGGIPDVGAIRIAVTDPNLRNADTMSTGYAIGKFNPDVGLVTTPDIAHRTYSSQIAGDPVGMFGVPLPYDIMFPDFAKQMRELYPTSRADYIASRKPPVQILDQEWLDNISKAIEDFYKKEPKK